MAIVRTAEFDGALGGLRESHTRSGSLPKDAFIRDQVILGFTAETRRRDFFKFLRSIHGDRMRGPRHRVSRLAASGHARIRKMLRRVAPYDIALFPGDAQNLRTCAVNVDHRLGSQIADSRLELDPALGRDDEQSIEAYRAADVTAKRYANSARFGSDPFGAASRSLAPIELFRSTLKRFLKKCASRVLKFTLYRRPVLRLAFRTVHVADRDLVHAELSCRFRNDRLDDRDPLQSAGRALRAARRRVRQHGNATPAHRLWLVQQRNHAPRRRGIALCVVRTVVRYDEHIQSQDPPFFGKSDFHSTLKTGPRASDKRLLFTADPHHRRRVCLLRQQRRDNHGDAARDLAAESAARIFADENDLLRIHVQPSCDRGTSLRRTLSS